MTLILMSKTTIEVTDEPIVYEPPKLVFECGRYSTDTTVIDGFYAELDRLRSHKFDRLFYERVKNIKRELQDTVVCWALPLSPKLTYLHLKIEILLAQCRFHFSEELEGDHELLTLTNNQN